MESASNGDECWSQPVKWKPSRCLSTAKSFETTLTNHCCVWLCLCVCVSTSDCFDRARSFRFGDANTSPSVASLQQAAHAAHADGLVTQNMTTEGFRSRRQLISGEEMPSRHAMPISSQRVTHNGKSLLLSSAVPMSSSSSSSLCFIIQISRRFCFPRSVMNDEEFMESFRRSRIKNNSPAPFARAAVRVSCCSLRASVSFLGKQLASDVWNLGHAFFFLSGYVHLLEEILHNKHQTEWIIHATAHNTQQQLDFKWLRQDRLVCWLVCLWECSVEIGKNFDESGRNMKNFKAVHHTSELFRSFDRFLFWFLLFKFSSVLLLRNYSIDTSFRLPF